MRNLGSTRIGKIGLRILVVVIAAFNLNLLAADDAQAAGDSLFTGQFTFFGAFNPFVWTWPLTPAPDKEPPGDAYIGNTLPQQSVYLERSFLHPYSTYYCVPGQCFPGYPVSGGFYDYVNGRGHFRANNPYGASTDLTIRFATTITPPPTIPYGSGDPATPTTAHGGRYDFSRAGTIMMNPGPNRFSGSMRFIFGPQASFYQLITVNYPFTSRAYGSFLSPPNPGYPDAEFLETVVGETTSSGMVTRFRLTSLGGDKATTAGGGYVTAKAYYLHSLGNWTTGMISNYQPLGTYLTRQTHTGYDNRTIGGLSGTLSLVRPRLTHTYLNNPFGSPQLSKSFSAARTWQLKVFMTNAPEPGSMVLLGAGILTIAGLTRLRRR